MPVGRFRPPNLEGTGKFDVDPARACTSISFDRDEQVGEYVYHCRILEHEDLGMMAKVQLTRSSGDHACAGPHRLNRHGR